MSQSSWACCSAWRLVSYWVSHPRRRPPRSEAPRQAGARVPRAAGSLSAAAGTATARGAERLWLTANAGELAAAELGAMPAKLPRTETGLPAVRRPALRGAGRMCSSSVASSSGSWHSTLKVSMCAGASAPDLDGGGLLARVQDQYVFVAKLQFGAFWPILPGRHRSGLLWRRMRITPTASSISTRPSTAPTLPPARERASGPMKPRSACGRPRMLPVASLAYRSP